jgi:glucose dehydrogenase
VNVEKWLQRLTRVNSRLGTVAMLLGLVLLLVLIMRLLLRGLESFGLFEMLVAVMAVGSIATWARENRTRRASDDR